MSGLGGVLGACGLPERYGRGKVVDLSEGPASGPQWVQVLPPAPARVPAANPPPPPAKGPVVAAPPSTPPLQAPVLLPAEPPRAPAQPCPPVNPAPPASPAPPQSPPATQSPPPERRQLQLDVRIAPDANDTSPVALSVVVVYNPIVARALRALSASQWFEARQELLLEYVSAIDEELWELVPGQPVEPIVLPLREGPAEVLLFARYRSEGLHSASFSPGGQPVQLLLGTQELSIAQEPVLP